MAEVYRIGTEDDAFSLLTQLVDGLALGPDCTIQFEGWPRFVITVKGADFDGTIPTRIMPTLLELQRQVHRLYCNTTYGTDNLRRLSREDKEGLELLVRVEKGSSFFETLLNEPFVKTLQAAVDKMTPSQIMIILILFGFAATSLYGWKMWLAARAKDRELDHEVNLSRLETERMALIAQAAQQVPLAGMLAQTVDPVRHSLLSKLKPGDRLEIPTSSGLDTQAVPVVVDGDTAEQLTRSLRETSVERMVTDDFLLLAADFSKPGVVRVELQRVADDYAFRADVPAGVLDNEQERALRDKSWERQVLNLNVLVHDLHGRYTSAKVVAVRAL